MTGYGREPREEKMNQTKFWSLDGVAPEAQKRAQEAAAREGISVSEWLQRKLLGNAGNDASGAHEPARSASHPTRIDNAVHSMSRLLESNQRAQSDMHRAIGSIVADINTSTQDQANALHELSERVDRLERTSDTSELQDSIRALGTNVTRIADQAAREIAAAAGQIGEFSNAIEAMDEKVAAAKAESQRVGLYVQEQLSYAAERARAAEAGIAQAAETAQAVADLQRQFPRVSEIENAVAGIERFSVKAAGEISGLVNSVSTLGKQSAQLREETAGLSARIRRTEDRTASLEKLEGAVAGLKGRIGALDAVEHSLAALAGRETAAREQNRSLSEKLGSLSASFTEACEASVRTQKDVRSRISKLNEGLESAVSAMSALARADSVDQLNTRLSALGGIVQTAGAKIAAQEGLSEQLAGRIRAAETVLSSLPEIEHALARLNHQAMEAEARSISVRDSTAKLAERLSTAEAELSSYPEIREAVGRLQTQARESDAKIDAARLDAAAMTERLKSVEAILAKIPEIEAQLAHLMTRSHAYDQVEKSVAALGRREVETASRLAAIAEECRSHTEKSAADRELLAGRLQDAELRIAKTESHERRLNALDARLADFDAVADTVAALAGGVAGMSNRIDTATAELHDYCQKLSDENARFSERLDKAEQLLSNQARLEDRFDAFARRAAILDRLDDYFAKLAKVDAERIARIDELTRKIQVLEGWEHSARDELESITKRVLAAEERIEPVSDHESALSALTAEVSGLTGRLSETVNEVSGRLRAIEERGAGGGKQGESFVPEQMSGQIAELKAEIESRQAQNAQRLGALTSDLESLSAEMAALREQSAAVPPAAETHQISSSPDKGLSAPEPEETSPALATDELQPLPDLPPEPIGLSSIDDLAPRVAVEVNLEPINLVTDSPASLDGADYLGRARQAALHAAQNAKPEARANRNSWVQDARKKPPVLLGTAAGLLLAAAASAYFLIPGRVSVPTVPVAAVPGETSLDTAPALPDSAPAAGSIEAGQAEGAEMLARGMAYANGTGVERDDAAAAAWFLKAADAGVPMAQFQIGVAYEKGIGVAADAKEAARWYMEAANRGNVKSMYNLGVAYANGAGIEKNLGEAARRFEQAASYGLADALFNLAVLYEHGLGVTASLADAYKWYAIAASAGDADARMRVEAIATQLPPEQKDAADMFAASFQPIPPDPAANDLPGTSQASR